MLYKTFFRLFWNTYDNLGGWILLSFFACLFSLPLVTAPAAWGALLAAAARADREESIGLGRYWRDFLRLGWRSTALGLILLLGWGLCLYNMFFYASSPLAAHWPPLLTAAIRIFFFWLAVIGFLGLQMAWTLMAMLDLPLGKALRRGFLVLGAHPLPALFILVCATGLTALAWMSVLGAFVILGALLANLAVGFVAGIIEHYEEMEDRKERQRLKVEGPRSWTETRSLEEREAQRQRRYQRGWKDILRPWEMK